MSIINEIVQQMVFVQGGTFYMGNNDLCNVHGGPAHEVQLNDFCISSKAVTQRQYLLLVGINPSHHQGDLDRPVENVSWFDTILFTDHLNALSKMKFRLPTEAEWEYAARGGQPPQNFTYSGSNRVKDVAWTERDSFDHPHPVATKRPNRLGLYDMSGNVSEWCHDWHSDYVFGDIPMVNPRGPADGTEKIRRGGHHQTRNVSVFFRSKRPPENRYDTCGFRIAVDNCV